MPLTDLDVRMTEQDRTVLEHFREGVGSRTIGLRTGLEHHEVDEIIEQLTGRSRQNATRLINLYDAGKTLPPLRNDEKPQPKTTPATKTPPPPIKETPLPAKVTARALYTPPSPAPATAPEQPTKPTPAPSTEHHALQGTRDPLPEPTTIDALIAAAGEANVPALARLSTGIATLLAELRRTYEAECRTRTVRALIAEHRAALDELLTEYATLTAELDQAAHTQ